MFEYIAATPAIQDVVLSGGDCYSLEPHQLHMICSRLLDIPNVRRLRVATKGLCAHPTRTLDAADGWTDVLIGLSNEGKRRGKHVALHTHFNHPNEISWATREAAQKLFANGVTVRSQTVLLRGVNDDVGTMGTLLRELSDINIDPVSLSISPCNHKLTCWTTSTMSMLATLLKASKSSVLLCLLLSISRNSCVVPSRVSSSPNSSSIFLVAVENALPLPMRLTIALLVGAHGRHLLSAVRARRAKSTSISIRCSAYLTVAKASTLVPCRQ